MQAYLLFIEYQVVQFLPSISISEQFESMHLTILQQILILPLWNDGRQCMELILCRVVESSYSSTHNIVPHISGYDLPCHRITKKYADFPSMVIFQLLLRKFSIQTWFCNCLQYLCVFRIVFECIPGFHDQGMMFTLPKQLLCLCRDNVKLFLDNMSASCFGSQQIWFWFFGPNWFYQRINPTQLCGIWTCVSS